MLTCLQTHTHTHNQILHLSKCCHGPTLRLPSFPQLSSSSFVPRLHTNMSRSHLWGVKPGRRLVFRALLFFPFLFFSFLFPGLFSSVPVLANYRHILLLPTACCCCRAAYPPPTLPPPAPPPPFFCFSLPHHKEEAARGGGRESWGTDVY